MILVTIKEIYDTSLQMKEEEFVKLKEIYLIHLRKKSI